jgi:saccharopine dehydrogenase-like NADP-dependent oxidoreductase
MRIILIIGAGRSASSLIQYLLVNLKREITSLSVIYHCPSPKKTDNHPNATAIALDILMPIKERSDRKDIVISMLPAHLHIEVARDCVVYKKNLVTASYVSDAMQELDEL